MIVMRRVVGHVVRIDVNVRMRMCRTVVSMRVRMDDQMVLQMVL